MESTMPKHPPPNITAQDCLKVLIEIEYGSTLDRLGTVFNMSKRGVIRWMEQGRKGNESYVPFFVSVQYGKALRNIRNTEILVRQNQARSHHPFDESVMEINYTDNEWMIIESLRNARMGLIEEAMEKMNLPINAYDKHVKKRVNQKLRMIEEKKKLGK